MGFTLRVVLPLLAWLIGIPAAWALESGPVRTARTVATLVSDTDTVAPGQPLRVALRLRMAPGWHTYWKNPGDAGAPPEITLTLPGGATAGPIDWPTPGRMPEGPLMTYGYAGEVLLPVTITGAAGATRVKAEATWLVCKDICVPEEGTFVLDLPAGNAAPSAEAPLFAAHARSVPRPSPWQARIAPDGTLSVVGAELTAVREAWFIPDAPNVIQHEAPQTLAVSEGGFTLKLPLARPLERDQAIGGIVSIKDRTGQQADVLVRAEPGPAIAAEAAMPLFQVLAFAFFGGLILNLMPCVFPVLAMKAMALARGSATGQIRAHALSYTLGVLVTFAALGGALLAARSAGAAAGWGFQFQSPAFVAGMAWLLFAVGLNLSGVFQVGGGAVAGAGSSLAGRGGHAGSFFTGLLAVLVATPCTAPFMGVAIAAGLAAPPVVTLSVFLAMGLGLAAPYVALAVVPGLARLAPRPGAWMDVLKQVLAFPMYGAAVWLLWVVSVSAGPDGVLVTAIGFVLLGFGFWAFGRAQARVTGLWIGQGVLVLALLGAVGLLVGIASSPDAPRSAATADTWSAERLTALRQEGRPVFVNMTAAWCVTCLVNERVALRTDATQAAFATKGITYLKGDWTRQDPAITAFLRQFNRDGVPLYVYYPPGQGAPIMLPQILTEGTVLSAIGG